MTNATAERTITDPYQMESKVTSSAFTPMTVPAAGMKTVMLGLSSTYTDAELAVAREYVANAIDAHREAGQTRPVEVSSPTQWDPMFTVTDYGVGMTREQFEYHFCGYGVSSKLGGNNAGVVGKYGIGAKACFAIGPSATARTTRDGWTLEAVLELGADSTPGYRVISHERTDEPNGTRISVMCFEPERVAQACTKAFATWPSGSIMLDGELVTSIFDDEATAQVAPHAYLRAEHSGNRWLDVRVVMGGIAYTADYSLFDIDYHMGRKVNGTLYLMADIDAVDLTQTREAVAHTERSRAWLKKAVERLEAEYADFVQAKIDAADNLIDALSVAWHSSAVAQSVTYRGVAYSMRIESRYTHDAVVWRQGDERIERLSKLTFDQAFRSVVVVTDHPEKVSTYARALLETRDGTDYVVAIRPDAPGGGWLTESLDRFTSITLDEAKSSTVAWRRARRSKAQRKTVQPVSFTLADDRRCNTDMDNLSDVLTHPAFVSGLAGRMWRAFGANPVVRPRLARDRTRIVKAAQRAGVMWHEDSHLALADVIENHIAKHGPGVYDAYMMMKASHDWLDNRDIETMADAVNDPRLADAMRALDDSMRHSWTHGLNDIKISVGKITRLYPCMSLHLRECSDDDMVTMLNALYAARSKA